ncbi:MAG: sucrase ferredoxin [Streptosporangiales bacterium]|nr:sucrase ferredoxin [Streptosporangiales bacterium]
MTICVHGPDGHDGRLPLYGTATERARAWLLIEHPGPWPAHLDEMKTPPPMGSVVSEAEERGIRVQLIRRPRERRVPPPLQVYAAWSAGPDAWIEGRELAGRGDLRQLDLDALAEGRSPLLGERIGGRLLLVCTHGRRSACCARLGRPLAVTLADRFPEQVWETTHVGGDHFAANLVCLPHGLYYGRVSPTGAGTVAAAYGRGEIVLEHYRGRAGLPGPLQAAEYFVRAETGRLLIDEVSVESAEGLTAGPAVTEALVHANGSRYRVVVEEVAEAERGTCGLPCPEADARYRLVDLAPAAAGLSLRQSAE